MANGFTTPPPPSVSAPSGIVPAAPSSTLKDDSGIVDLAVASQADPQASVRAQTTALASQGLFDEESIAMHAAPMSVPPGAPFGGYGQPMQPVPTMPPPAPLSVPPASHSQDAFASQPLVAMPAAYDSQLVTALPTKKKGGVAAAVIIGVVALSAAAGGFLYVKGQKANTVAATTVAPITPATPAPVTTVAKADPPAALEAPSPVEAPAEPVVDTTPAPATPTKGSKVAMATKSAKGGAPVTAAPAAKADGPAKVTEKELAAAPSGPAGDLGKAMQQEVGDNGKAATPAAGGRTNAPTGNVPQKPSQGAVTGALGAVLPGARSCLGPDDPISRASVVFSSDGVVQSVSVSGGAAGKPAEACIKSALTKAKVQPFAEPTYTAPVTIRHL